jgi:TPR repeat protein
VAEIFEDWPYFAWALGAAATFYAVTAFATSHLHPTKKAVLADWLKGDYDSTWATQFCAIFDRIFGDDHFRPRCIAFSAIASVVAVLALWLLFDRILGLISLRADTGLSLTQALLIGAAINIVPDYISLCQTRLLLKQFERIRNPIGQLAVLIVDSVATGLIIFAGIQAYLWVTGTPTLSAVEIVAVFSFYAVFFYSTFLTSIWAWGFCLSSWLSRLSARLRGWLNVSEEPGRSLALLGAVFVLAGSFALQPALAMDENGRSAIDDFLCETFPAAACTHVARLTKDEQLQLFYLGKACENGVTEECFDAALKQHQIRPKEAVKLWTISCDTGNALACANLGVMYETALGVAQNEARAVDLYTRGCEGGHVGGCTNLGLMYEKALGVAQDDARAVELYRQGCEGGNAEGCTNLGNMYADALGVAQDEARAVELYRQGCEGGNAEGCTNLGFMYANARGVAQDEARAVNLYTQGCEGGNATACTNLGNMYADAHSVAQDDARAIDLYTQGCEGGDAWGCTNLGFMYQNALGVAQDNARAVDLYTQGCEGGDAWGCTNLGWMFEKAFGVAQNETRAVELYTQGCEGGNAEGCTNLGWMYRHALGVAQDEARAVALYTQGCEGGNALGCSNLGWMFETARGVPEDIERAEQLYNQACDMGNSRACERVETLSDVPK